MIGLALGALGGLASGIFGASKSAKAAREQQRLIDEQERKNNAWYNRNYYQNQMDTAEAQAAMKRVENTLKKQSEEARATAAVTGSTPEAVIAQQQANNELLADVATGIAAQGTQRKANVDAVNIQNQNSIAKQRMAQSQMSEAGSSQLMNNGLGLIGSALSLYQGKKNRI